jgi:thymidylate synthase (FAD)
MGQVRMIGCTQPFQLTGVQTGEQLIAYCARVSNPSNQANHTTAPRLLSYLARNQHWSPFEMVHVVMDITTTRDIARQILRHRSFSFQEFSQRYAESAEDAVLREVRMQDTANRQNSLEVLDIPLSSWWEHEQQWIADQATRSYQNALAQGIAKEVARAVLPEGLTSSRLYMAGSVRSWIHYVQLRTDKATQKEHREIADQCKTELLKAMPSLAEVMNEEV